MKKTNKWLLALMCACTTMGASLFAACGGSYKMTGFIVERPAVTTYTVGDEVDFSTLVMYATFSDDTTQSIPLDRVKIFLDGVEITGNLSKLTEKEGKFTIGFKYSDITKTFEITVAPPRTVADIVSVSLDSLNVVKTYEVGATNVTLNGLTVTLKFSDNGTETVPLDSQDLAFYCDGTNVTGNLAEIAKTKGTKTVTVLYKGKASADFITFEITNPLTGIEVDAANAKCVYNVGDTVDFSALSVTATYKDATTNSVALSEVKYYLGETEIEDLQTLSQTAGKKTITVCYEEKLDDFEITVNNYVTALGIDTTGVKLDYVEDGEISVADFAEVKINVVYADNTDTTVKKVLSLTDNGVKCELAGAAVVWENLTLTAGAKTINVSYGGKSTSFAITVAKGDTIVKTLEVLSLPSVTQFTAGGNVSLNGLVIKAIYEEGYSETEETIAFADFADKEVKLIVGSVDVTNDLNKIAQVEKLGESTVTVQVKYGQTATFNVTVTNSVKNLTLDTENVKTEYKVKDVAHFENIVVTAVCDYGTKTLGATDVKFFDGNTELTNTVTQFTAPADEKTITVKYEGKEATFKISVKDWVESLETSGTTSFECDVNAETLSFDGLIVTATYASGKSENVSASAEIAYKDYLKTPGTHKLAVIYGDKKAEISLEVFDVLESIEVLSGIPEKLTYGGTVNFNNAIVQGTYQVGQPKILEILGSDEQFLRGVVAFELLDEDKNWRTITYNLGEITTVSGERTIRLSYTERGKTVYKEIKITVSEPLPEVSAYAEPIAWTQYNNTLKTATNDLTAANFENEYFKNDTEDYLVGDDNPYLFLPVLTQLNIADETVTTLQAFKAISTITAQLQDGGEYVLLERTVKGNTYEYSHEGTVYVIEYYGQNKYQFVENVATGLRFTVSVLPDDTVFDYDETAYKAISCSFKVTDGYNVTDSKELCLLEQTTRRTDWNEIKASLGLTNVRPNAIVLHRDMLITTDSIPKTLYYTLDTSYNIVYTYEKDGQTVTCSPEEVPADMGGPLTRNFLWDKMKDDNYGIFEYQMNAGETFAIHGNYFNLDASKLPLVASFEPSGVVVPAGGKTFYGDDFSNVSLIEVHGDWNTATENDESFSFSNFAVKSNAANNPLYTKMDSYQGSVYGGGLIFLKMQAMKAIVDNVRANNCFIAYFPDWYAEVEMSRCKAYDSFQNAVFAFANADTALRNCHMKRAAGPLILMQEKFYGTDQVNYAPKLNIATDCVMESYVTGREQWFASVGADALLPSLLATDALLQGYFKKSFYYPNSGKVNMVAATLNSEEFNGLNVVTTQGYVGYGTSKIDRMWQEGSALAVTNLSTVQALALSGAATPITFNVGDYLCAVGTDNASLVALLNGSLVNLAQAAQTSQEGAAIYGAFAGTEYKHVALNVGSISILMEYFDLPKA